MNPILPREMQSGRVAYLERTAGAVRREALGLGRAPVDAADAEMGRRRVGAARVERVLIRARASFVFVGLVRKPQVRYDVLTVSGTETSLYAADCVFWEEAVALASDALKGRVSVAMGGRRSVFSPGSLAPDVDIAPAKGLAGSAGTGWRRPAPGEVVVVKARQP